MPFLELSGLNGCCMYGNSKHKLLMGVDTSWPVIGQRVQFLTRSKQERLVVDSQGSHIGAA